MSSHLFFASTPFNMLTASMVAFSLPATDDKHLCLIDQPEQDSHFVKELLNWSGSPFKSSQLISRKNKGRNKREFRNIAFKVISSILSDIQPDTIYTGNDRRIEFQYAIAHAKKQTIGVYIDDGTYSYLGRKTHWIKDHFIDNILKKLSYGFWWKQPKTIGSSIWIKECIVAFPEMVTPALMRKRLKQLPANLNRSEFKELSSKCIDHYPNLANLLLSLDSLLLFPHESVFSEETIPLFQNLLSSSSGIIGVKHHPRTKNKSTFLLKSDQELPATVPIEVILPLIKDECQIFGDISTALLTAKWLRPELEVTALSSGPVSDGWNKLLSTIGIHVIGHN